MPYRGSIEELEPALFWSRLVSSVEIASCPPTAIWPLSVVNRQKDPIRPERHVGDARDRQRSPVRGASRCLP